MSEDIHFESYQKGILLGVVLGWTVVTWAIVHVWGDWVKVFVLAVQYFAVYVIGSAADLYFAIRGTRKRHAQGDHSWCPATASCRRELA